MITSERHADRILHILEAAWKFSGRKNFICQWSRLSQDLRCTLAQNTSTREVKSWFKSNLCQQRYGFTYEEVQHHFLTRNGVALVQTVDGASQPGYPVSRYLYQFHQGSDAPPGRVLAGTDSHPLGKPQVDGQQGAERYAQESGVETYAILLRQPLTTCRAGGGAGAPSTSGALRGSEAGGGRVGTLPLKQVRLGWRTGQRLRQRQEVAAAARTAKHWASTATTWIFSFRRGHFVSLLPDRRALV